MFEILYLFTKNVVIRSTSPLLIILVIDIYVQSMTRQYIIITRHIKYYINTQQMYYFHMSYRSLREKINKTFFFYQ